ncbi:hypothetical protein DNTS_029120 [Danionella cerebrum]|uniref:Kinase n=1 Tax=Danionella cerebrum TaxID=2873325 RepID=A0A553MRS9_9TELE|nr:hypothetical protein DNTS_029120 [Danionella translucida]
MPLKFCHFWLNLSRVWGLVMTTGGRIMNSPLVTLDEVEKKNCKNGSIKQELLDGCVPFSHQVAGHKKGTNNTGVLQHPDGSILKQLQPPPRGPRERHFYTQVYARACTDKTILDLQQHLPNYYGTWAPRESPHELYLKLEDVTRRFSQPCIMDVKIGRRSYDPFASKEKQHEQISKYPLMEEIGFLLLGMRVYQVTSDSYISHDQFFGRSLGKDTIKSGLMQFFHNGQDLRRRTISLIIEKIQNILHWFLSQSQLHFYASSLLLVYEGAYTPDHHERSLNSTCGSTGEMEEEAVEVKMIDFAHVFPSDCADEGYIYGLRSLLDTLEQILMD